MLSFIIIGLSDGSIYAIAALGLTMSYKTSGVFNFAHGAVAAGAAYVFFQFHDLWRWPWPVAAVISVGGYGVVAGLLLERFASRIASVPTSMKIAGTLGLLLVVQYGVQIHYGTAARPFPEFLPTSSFSLAGVRVQYSQLVAVVVAVGAAGGLALFFRRSRLGVAMRAVVDDPGLLDLTGTSPARVRRASWVIGAAFAALSGILIGPRLGLDAGLLTLLVLQAYSAGAIGAFTNLALVYAGGLGVGVLQQVVAYETSKVNNYTLNSLPPTMPFVILFLVLLVLPKSRLQEIGRSARATLASPPALPRRVRLGASVVGLAVLLAIPHVVGPKLPEWSAAMTYTALFLSLALLVRTSNQVSLCQVAFAAVGASTFAHLTAQAGVPWLFAIVLAGLAAVPLGAVIAIPAIRLSGLFLALATFGLGILLSQVGYRSFLMFGSSNGIEARRPSLPGIHLTTDTGYYYVILAVVLGCVAIVKLVEGARLGRLLKAMADSPLALTTHGASVNVTRVLVFCVSSFIAGISGALFAPLNGVVTGTTFPYFDSVALLAVLAVATLSLRGLSDSIVAVSFVAALLLEVLPGYITSATFGLYLQVIFGASAMLAAVAAAPRASGTGTPALHRGGRSPVRARLARLDTGAAPACASATEELFA